jgi:hypothetical protein
LVGDLFHLGDGSVPPIKPKLPADHNSVVAEEYGSYTMGGDRSHLGLKVAFTLYLGVASNARCRLILL